MEGMNKKDFEVGIKMTRRFVRACNRQRGMKLTAEEVEFLRRYNWNTLEPYLPEHDEELTQTNEE